MDANIAMTKRDCMRLCVLVVTLATAAPSGSTLAGIPSPTVTPATVGSTATPEQVNRSAPGLDAYLVHSGERVYAALLTARDAARQEDTEDARRALHDLQRQLDELTSPKHARSLRAQLKIIRAGMGEPTERTSGELWVPVVAELDQIPVDDPDVTGSQGSVGSVIQEDGESLSEVGYRFGWFPLAAIREDILSSLASAGLPLPYWRGVRSGVQSALHQFRWLIEASDLGMIDAYFELVDAHRSWPHDRDRALVALSEASRKLQSAQGGNELAAEAWWLTRKDGLQLDDIAELLGAVKTNIQIIAGDTRSMQR